MPDIIPNYFRITDGSPGFTFLPTEFRVNRLNQVPLVIPMACNRGTLTLPFIDGGTHITITVGLAKMLTSDSNCLRVLAVRQESDTNKDENHSLVLEGSQFGNMGYVSRGISKISASREYTPGLDKCLRVMAGVFNLLHNTGTLKGSVIDPGKLLRIMSREFTPFIIRSALTDPLQGITTLVQEILATRIPIAIDMSVEGLMDSLFMGLYPDGIKSDPSVIGFTNGNPKHLPTLHGGEIGFMDIANGKGVRAHLLKSDGVNETPHYHLVAPPVGVMGIDPHRGQLLACGLMSSDTRSEWIRVHNLVSQASQVIGDGPIVGYPIGRNGCYYLPLLHLVDEDNGQRYGSDPDDDDTTLVSSDDAWGLPKQSPDLGRK